MTSKHWIAASACAALAGLAHAQTQAPGLWESTMTMKSAGGEMERAQAQMQAQLAAMSPAQRKQVEDMMASRGVKIGAQGTTVKTCITKEQAARSPEPRLTGDCTSSDVQHSGNTLRFKFACTRPRASSGEGEWVFTSDKSYTGKLSTTAEVNGKAQPITMALTGQWLGADCGDVKPVSALPAK